MTYSADPDQLASSETDLDLYYLKRQGISGFSRTRVKGVDSKERICSVKSVSSFTCCSCPTQKHYKTFIINQSYKEINIRNFFRNAIKQAKKFIHKFPINLSTDQ